MLKRQRASSPSPLSPIMPEGTASEDIIDIRDLKRRRVAPPPLEGQMRGWTNPSSSDSTEEDYEEEGIFEDGFQDVESKANVAQSAQGLRNEEYAAVNSVLKEIHILQKHRQASLPRVYMPTHTLQDYPPQSPLDKSHSSYQPAGPMSDESVRVYEHYEGTNRSLASAFLSRRQHSADQP